MVRKSLKSVRLNAQTVNVTPSTKPHSGKQKSLKKSPSSGAVSQLDKGRMTNDTISSLRGSRCGMDPNEEGWYFKYLDPAGSVETGRAIGEFSKIPDGLCTFSVDAEIRALDTLTVPTLDTGDEPPGSISLDGRTWSVTLISYPLFRIGFIAVANVYDYEVSDVVRQELCYELNNLEDYRRVIDAKAWVPFAPSAGDGWFYQIFPLPPTYDLPDPINGGERTVSSYRLAYKSLTIEHNAPTLIDQGFWAGGQYAIDSSSLPMPTMNTSEVPSWMMVRTIGSGAVLTIRNLPPDPVPSPGASTEYYQLQMLTGGSYAMNLNPGYTMYSSFGTVWAEFGDVITFTLTPTTFTANSTHVGASPLSLPVPAIGAEDSIRIYLDLPDGDTQGSYSSLELPALTLDQIAANNPKMEQFLMKESGGAYVVHKKLRNPVFRLTPASSYGPLQFTTPGYVSGRNHLDGSGILDSVDANMSTISVCVRGISHANVLVVKLYQGWEGLTNVNTPFGQFGHSGLPRNDEVLALVDNLNVRTTGIYPANDNFLGAIAKFAAGALKNLLASEATVPMLGNIAKRSVETGVGWLQRRMARL